MNDKQKVTFYIPSELHHRLKIRAAVDSEPMSAIAERAIVFYLTHSEVVDEVELTHGQTHRVYACPECSSSVVIRDGEMESAHSRAEAVVDDSLSVAHHVEDGYPTPERHDREELVPC